MSAVYPAELFRVKVMNYANIKYCDIANGVGVRTSVFVSGCRNHCKECFNRETWDFAFGKPFTEETENEVIESVAPDYIAGLTVLGGEPFEPENQAGVLDLIRKIKAKYPGKSVWVYSGFTLEELRSGSRASGRTCDEILSLIDVLVDGRFVQEKYNISLRFRGSENQRIIDMPGTRKEGKIVLWEDSL